MGIGEAQGEDTLGWTKAVCNTVELQNLRKLRENVGAVKCTFKASIRAICLLLNCQIRTVLKITMGIP